MEWDELWAKARRNIPRAWELAVTELACAPPSDEDIARMEAKARAGHDEHGGDVVRFNRERFRQERQGEADDLVTYYALELALLG